MKTIIVLSFLWLMLVNLAASNELTLERQREIIERYMYVTSQGIDRSLATGESSEVSTVPEKCGTPAILDYYRNLDRLDRQLLTALGVKDVLRPVTDAEYGIPGGHALIHYDTAGQHAVWQAGIDADGDAVPDYVEALAEAAELAYDYIIDTLGFAPPLDDSSCLNGDDSRVDIYLQALPFGFYGMTHNQSECYDPDFQHEASWILIDHNFQRIPDYVNQPLAAAQVTIAHELFHTVHFSLDATEHTSWFEMSSVWMEEEVFDDVNDYYLYDYVFFDRPWISLQDTVILGHMYQAAIFPMYVSQKYGRDVIRAVWERSGALGPGPNFLQAFDFVIDSASTDPANARYECLCYNQNGTICLDSTVITESFASALAEFAVWNFFTGPYASQAPNGIGYEEAEFYDFIPVDSMDVRHNYPLFVSYAESRFEPSPNAALYLRLENLQSIPLDTLLEMWFSPDSNAIVQWGVSGIFQMENNPDSHLVVSDVIDVWKTCFDTICTLWEYSMGDSTCVEDSCATSGLFSGRFVAELIGEWVCTDGQFGSLLPCGPSTCTDSSRVIDLRPYRSLTLVLTPASTSTGPYAFGNRVEFGFSVYDSSFVDQNLVNLPASVLTPYPNPAIVSEMEGEGLTFRLQATTDTTGFSTVANTVIHLEIYSVAGELVRATERSFSGSGRQGLAAGGMFEIEWDMKNEADKDVASGVYLVVARLYAGSKKGLLLAEDRTKVVVIR